ncbi:hypothetical protein FS749_009357 [Ceratobasidium sp. UAMH 11750]|nr:hypothetical protein FS749_009357 [Ceratobasidium sp. UAMH 11750]
MERLGESNSRVETGEHGDRECCGPPSPGALHLAHLHTPLVDEGSSREASGQQLAVVSPMSLERGERDLNGGLDHSHRPHDPGGRPWELNVTSTAKTTKKLQTAYYSAMLQFVTTGLCLAVASGSWIWAAVDERVSIE